MDLLIIDTIHPEVLEWLSLQHEVRYAPELVFDGRELRLALHKARAVIAPARVAFNESMLLQAPLLRAVGRINGGAENIDLQACSRSGVDVVRSGTGTAHAEAEFMVGAALSMLRRVPVADLDGTLVGRELGSCTVGLLGMSPSAKSLSTMLRGFGCHLYGYDPSLHATDSLWERWHVAPVALLELFEISDLLCIQLPFFSRYQGLLGERILPYCKPNQVVVCATHAAVFDGTLLAEMLHSGQMASAWLDSIEPGWLDENGPLHGVPNLQVTPQLASTTLESKLRSAWDVARRIDELLKSAVAPYADFRGTFPGEPLDLAGDSTLR
jgi:D-3-phosphoglycerate dehydrogenase / 2-oxoglutarate reductase